MSLLTRLWASSQSQVDVLSDSIASGYMLRCRRNEVIRIFPLVLPLLEPYIAKGAQNESASSLQMTLLSAKKVASKQLAVSRTEDIDNYGSVGDGSGMQNDILRFLGHIGEAAGLLASGGAVPHRGASDSITASRAVDAGLVWAHPIAHRMFDVDHHHHSTSSSNKKEFVGECLYRMELDLPQPPVLSAIDNDIHVFASLKLPLEVLLPRLSDICLKECNRISDGGVDDHSQEEMFLAACECFHAVILFAVGMSVDDGILRSDVANPAARSGSIERLSDPTSESRKRTTDFYRKVLPVVLRLCVCERQPICQALFEKLFFQIIRWFSGGEGWQV